MIFLSFAFAQLSRHTPFCNVFQLPSSSPDIRRLSLNACVCSRWFPSCILFSLSLSFIGFSRARTVINWTRHARNCIPETHTHTTIDTQEAHTHTHSHSLPYLFSLSFPY